jgi:glycosyltransferase involved in cell wall biosynthesis
MLKPDKPIGGTELLYNRLIELVDMSDINLIVSVCHPSLLSITKPNVLWQHLSYNQENVALLQDVNYVNMLDAIVFVSHWQHEQFRKRFPLDNVPCYVIQNAIDAFNLETITKPKKIKLIYTSTPWRGLEILAEVLKRLDRDVDVDVYSGTSIYGPAFDQDMAGRFDNLYNTLKQLGVNHTEYAPNAEVRKAVSSAHILAYPSVFEETSCLAAIEALSAGCRVVTTNFGALYETCGDWADYIPLSNNIVERYTKALQYNIDNYWSLYETTIQQRKHYNKFWSWQNSNRLNQWKQLIDEVSNG